MRKRKVTFYKGRRRFTKWFNSFRKAANAKAAMRKRRWGSSRVR